MPTLECLDERSKAILEKLDDMDTRYSQIHSEFRFNIQETSKTLSQRIAKLEMDLLEVRIDNAKELGKKQGVLWAGGIALAAFSAIFGAIGNVLWTWLTGPNSPLR